MVLKEDRILKEGRNTLFFVLYSIFSERLMFNLGAYLKKILLGEGLDN